MGKTLAETIREITKKHIDKIEIKKKFKSLFKTKDLTKIIKFMKIDKKNISNNINIILIKDFGNIVTNYHVSEKKLKKFLFLELKK